IELDQRRPYTRPARMIAATGEHGLHRRYLYISIGEIAPGLDPLLRSRYSLGPFRFAPAVENGAEVGGDEIGARRDAARPARFEQRQHQRVSTGKNAEARKGFG